MILTTLLVGTLAVTWAGEALRVVLPWSLPSWLRPFPVLLFAVLFVWPNWHLAVGIAGGAAIVQATLFEYLQQRDVMQFRTRGRIPPLP